MMVENSLLFRAITGRHYYLPSYRLAIFIACSQLFIGFTDAISRLSSDYIIFFRLGFIVGRGEWQNITAISLSYAVIILASTTMVDLSLCLLRRFKKS